MSNIKTPEELGTDHCKYCEWGDIPQSINFLCEGRKCSEAYENYLEEMYLSTEV